MYSERAIAHSAGPVYWFVSLWFVGLFFSRFVTQFFVICVLALKSAIKNRSRNRLSKKHEKSSLKLQNDALGFQNELPGSQNGAKRAEPCPKWRRKGT